MSGGSPSRDPTICGLPSCWELWAPAWQCSDLAPGPSMLTFLAGSASRFGIGGCPSPSKGLSPGITIEWTHGASIWGCAPLRRAPLSVAEETKEPAVRSGFSKRCADHVQCDLCRHEESILGRKLCPVCLEAIARLAYAVGACASPLPVVPGVERCLTEGRVA